MLQSTLCYLERGEEYLMLHRVDVYKRQVADRMETMGIHLDAGDAAVKELAKEGFDPKYGARPLRRAIQSKVEDAVAEKLLDGTLKEGDTAKLAVEDDKLVVTK